MWLNLLNISRRTALAGFLALFPGFLLYHYSVVQGWIPPFLGGLFGIVSLLLACVCLLLVPWMIDRQLGAALVPGTTVFVLVAFVTGWAALHALAIREPYAADAFVQTAGAVGTWLAVLYVGMFYPFDEPRAKRLLGVAAALVVAALVHAMVSRGTVLGPYLTFTGVDAEAPASTYQGIARSILVTVIVLAASVTRTPRRFLLFALGTAMLLMVGSRKDLLSMAALTATMVGLLILRRPHPLTIGGVVVAVAALVYFTAPIFLETRNAELLDVSSSSSWQARSALQSIALGVIRQEPLFGAFGYHFELGGSGFYSHNALSAWTNYGLLGFLLYMGLIVYFTLASLRRVAAADVPDPAWFAAFHLNFVALIQAVGATPVFAPLPALGWGIALNAMREEARRREAAAPGAVPA